MSVGAEIEDLCARFSGTAGVSALNLENGEKIAVRSDETFPTASAIKVFVLLALFQAAEGGEIDLKERVTIDEARHTLGSGVLLHMDPGLSPTLADLAVLMMMLSDNTATNSLITKLGLQAINTSISRLGLQHTRLSGPVDFSLLAHDPSALGVSTPAELSWLYRALAHGELLDPGHTTRMLDVLRIQKYIEPLRRELPANPYAREFGDEELVWVASKTGSLSGIRVDAGLVHTPRAQWAIAVMTKNGTDQRVTSDNEGVRLIARVSRVVYDAWS